MERFQLLPLNRVKVMDVSSSQESSDEESQREIVLVAVDASKKMTDYALNWALANLVVHPGDRIVFQAIAPASSTSNSSDSVWKSWGFPALGGECAAAAAASLKATRKEELEEIRNKCSMVMEKLRKIHDLKKVHTTLEILQFARRGVIPSEAKRFRATWVVLDRNLKSEGKLCLQELNSNIVVVHRSNPKILRLNLKRRDLPYDEEESIDSSSVLLNGLSLSVMPKGFDQLYWESSTSSSEASSPDSRLVTAPKFELSVLEELLKNETRRKGPPSEVLNSTTPSPASHKPQVLNDFLRMKESREYTEETDTQRNVSRPVDRVSSVRKQIHLRKQSSPQPPPLCSICQHKTPVFGKPPRKFTFAELQLATGGFSDVNFLAEGGYGSVYRGRLPDGQAVAVKQHKLASTQGDKEFCAEVEVLSCAQQRNLVMLIGYCAEDKKRLLVYEFVCNGSLDSHLYGRRSKTVTLEWPARQKIALGAARALRYLHEECRVGCIVHRDVRPNNILLTHDFEPMVGDFGLARWQPNGELGVETRVIGAFGYLAPEYTQTGQITEKADVYSFGIVLLELVSGRKAVDLSRNKGEMCLSEWARPFLREQKYEKLIDQRLRGRFCVNEVENMLLAATLCIDPDPLIRPRMSQVLRLLEGDSLSDTSLSSSSSGLLNGSPVSILLIGDLSQDSSSSRSSSASSVLKSFSRTQHSSRSSSNAGSPLNPAATQALAFKKYNKNTTRHTQD
ncbi:inactive protein kinase SELMODRAFT_444075-like isoform X1 [Selaginella moellendorffii]|uniref:inactive protein kinase SELMODRAFT_444075-like isoform X1 n=1 Tax=Selaginella moellendorffii TaxID=88036 RepID=UPI000D1C6D7E|nr:inactive protein kinase SELMODRAFT_444075-like isoform X1 [Selaginella moellendorffii]XP_024516090.1 inactive protein kinase SELMODRAFT_444075-like isoform X1 [Selaginella moellendorffii]|eukprot:XP_024516089.1 inactive protein kinase SELMODRAFT_444075-like isoform X1 [Selaginella moellendorffii]